MKYNFYWVAFVLMLRYADCYTIPKPRIEILSPRGFRVSIPGKRITLTISLL